MPSPTFALILAAVYWLSTRSYNHWKRQNLPCLPNPIPGFGHILSVVGVRINLPEFAHRAYKSTDASMIGFYFMQSPAVIVRDPELVKSVLTTNFWSFHNNSIQLNEKTDPVMMKNAFFATDPDAWRVLRARVTNHLTGKKLRCLFVITQKVCDEMDSYIDRKIKENDGSYECELKKHFIKCTGEIVANAGFGIRGQSFEDNPDRLSFASVAEKLFEPTLLNGLKQTLLVYLPGIAKFFGVGYLPKQADAYFRKNVKLIVEERKRTGSAPDDFLQFSLDFNTENDLDSILADVINFYGDVYETTSLTVSHLCYHLSQNLEVQEKLRKHILSKLEATNGEVTYESLKSMDYLDQAISESMRLTAPVGALFKLCTE